MLGCSGQEGRQTGCCFILSLIFFFLTQHSTKDSLEHSRHLWLHFSLSPFFIHLFISRLHFLSSRFQPYNQKEPPVVRVVEGPLFCEVVAHYQHFQQTIRINNVPGNKRAIISVLKMASAKGCSCLVKGARWYNTKKGPICLTK